MDSLKSWITVQEKNISIIAEIISQHEREIEMKNEYVEVMKKHLLHEEEMLRSAKKDLNTSTNG